VEALLIRAMKIEVITDTVVRQIDTITNTPARKRHNKPRLIPQTHAAPNYRDVESHSGARRNILAEPLWEKF